MYDNSDNEKFQCLQNQIRKTPFISIYRYMFVQNELNNYFEYFHESDQVYIVMFKDKCHIWNDIND